MTWCEENNVKYVLGLAGNSRLAARLAPQMRKAKRKAKRTGSAAREFADFEYRTRKSWSCERRVVGKAEYLAKGANPRFVVTSLASEQKDARTLYEDFYCARGDMENRIKEQQRMLFADRTSCHGASWRSPPTAFGLYACAVRRAQRVGERLRKRMATRWPGRSRPVP